MLGNFNGNPVVEAMFNRRFNARGGAPIRSMEGMQQLRQRSTSNSSHVNNQNSSLPFRTNERTLQQFSAPQWSGVVSRNVPAEPSSTPLTPSTQLAFENGYGSTANTLGTVGPTPSIATPSTPSPSLSSLNRAFQITQLMNRSDVQAIGLISTGITSVDYLYAGPKKVRSEQLRQPIINQTMSHRVVDTMYRRYQRYEKKTDSEIDKNQCIKRLQKENIDLKQENINLKEDVKQCKILQNKSLNIVRLEVPLRMSVCATANEELQKQLKKAQEQKNEYHDINRQAFLFFQEMGKQDQDDKLDKLYQQYESKLQQKQWILNQIALVYQQIIQYQQQGQ